MAIKNNLILLLTVMISSVLLAFINYIQGYQNIIIYMSDYNKLLSAEAILDRIFVNKDFDQNEHMEGNSVLHFISPYTFYLVSIFWGSISFIMIKKTYHQLVFSRVKLQRDALRIIRGPYILNVTLFVLIYVGSIFMFIFLNDVLEFDYPEQIIRQFLFFIIASTLISLGLSSIMFYLYLRFQETIALLIVFILISALFIMDLQLKNISLVFISKDSYFFGGMIVGIFLIILSHVLLRNLKYKIV
ncbi:hypothetical protein SRABI96_04429 [Peribacillus sp. Bi96]|uniref:hypothetical protein n=1 Tax=unclassified Peribacillus TaxID=2675266 RepID=UPI001D1EA17F|nr:hypothetical protein [Peribacillus sp. Bi96]CAH0296029.1 hypothetical protein SRABI96_04429 [Peribacillus sp. Bi96]